MGAALLAHQQRMVVFVSDQKSIPVDFKSKLIELEIDFEEDGHVIAYDMVPDLVVISPGIPSNSTIVNHLLLRGVEIISEIEFAFRFCKGKIIAITGSNGKTTSTNLCAHILETSGFQVAKVGNVGYSFARSVAEFTYDYYVIEVSSFQLDHINTFRPSIAIILNITPDHLDRYDYNFQNYIDSKFRIALFQNEQDDFIVSGNDPVISKSIELYPIQSRIHKLQIELDQSDQVWINDRKVAVLRGTSLKGKHNAVNMACVLRALEILGLKEEQIQKGLNSFVNDPHRLESLGEINGVEFINDSKATNVDSVYWALDAMKKPVIWIAGGQDKGNEYDSLQSFVKEKVKALIGLGVDNMKLLDSFRHTTVCFDTNNITSAVQEAWLQARPGDVILLSPACASFDLFKNYMDRGDQFKNEFLKIKQSIAS